MFLGCCCLLLDSVECCDSSLSWWSKGKEGPMGPGVRGLELRGPQLRFQVALTLTDRVVKLSPSFAIICHLVFPTVQTNIWHFKIQ